MFFFSHADISFNEFMMVIPSKKILTKLTRVYPKIRFCFRIKSLRDIVENIKQIYI